MDPIRLRAARASSKVLATAVSPILRRHTPLSRPAGFASAVFVIGPPRSGTTLVYQLLQRVMGLRAWTNRDAHLYTAPYLAFARRAPQDLPSAFSSVHGRTDAPNDVHEAASLWYRWFDRTQSPWGQTLDPRATQSLRTELRWCARLAGQSIVWKNTYNSARVAALAAALPEAVFVVVERDVFATASSILNARAHDDASGWWSLPVPGADALLAQPPARQAIAQVVRTYHGIDASIAGLRRAPIRVRYEALCRDPATTLGELQRQLAADGVRLRAAASAVPEPFEHRVVEPTAALRTAALAERAWSSVTTREWFASLEGRS